MRHFLSKYSMYVGVATVAWAMLGAVSVQAAKSDGKTFVSADNTFYVFAKGGEQITAAFNKSSEIEPGGIPMYDVTVNLDGPGLPVQTCVIPKAVPIGNGCEFKDVVAPQTGVYRVQFALPAEAQPYPEVSPDVKWGGNLFHWNVAVKDGSTEIQGRVWSELYAVRQSPPASFMTDLTYFYVSENGYIYRAAYKGYNGQISTLSADAVGIRKNKSCTSAYQSVSVQDKDFSPSFGSCGGSYKLFFEQPSGDLPPTAKRWDDKKTWVSPNVAPPKVSELTFTSNKTGDTQSGKITYRISNFVGQYSVDIDTNGDGSFNAQEDIKIRRTMKNVDTTLQEVRFDGVDAKGQVVSPTQKITIRINVEKAAEIHLVNADVEGRSGGIELTRINGENAPSSRMCWNDTKLTLLANETLQTTLLDGRDCPDSTEKPLHGWSYATGSWGDGRYIDDWAFATVRVDGTTQIVYPEDVQITQIATRDNRVMIIVGAVVLTAVFVGLSVAVVVRRKRHAAMLRNAAQYHQPDTIPGPGDPGPPQQSK